ncbi:hypothetical protein GOODEAATRI_004624 [Goodea atripinnis]|uniref:Uncharacterized protein n=1 Tax=Goodea atripinnis TaxID=208336 RepID=A0ABV0NHH3_9TELE
MPLHKYALLCASSSHTEFDSLSHKALFSNTSSTRCSVHLIPLNTIKHWIYSTHARRSGGSQVQQSLYILSSNPSDWSAPKDSSKPPKTLLVTLSSDTLKR